MVSCYHKNNPRWIVKSSGKWEGKIKICVNQQNMVLGTSSLSISPKEVIPNKLQYLYAHISYIAYLQKSGIWIICCFACGMKLNLKSYTKQMFSFKEIENNFKPSIDWLFESSFLHNMLLRTYQMIGSNVVRNKILEK